MTPALSRASSRGTRFADETDVRELSFDDLPPVLGTSPLNLIRRGADGSLRLSADRWRLAEVSQQAVIFRSLTDDTSEPEQIVEVSALDVRQLTWDRLPKQQTRSQLRLHLKNGDLWTFSGNLTEPKEGAG